MAQSGLLPAPTGAVSPGRSPSIGKVPHTIPIPNSSIPASAPGGDRAPAALPVFAAVCSQHQAALFTCCYVCTGLERTRQACGSNMLLLLLEVVQRGENCWLIAKRPRGKPQLFHSCLLSSLAPPRLHLTSGLQEKQGMWELLCPASLSRGLWRRGYLLSSTFL